MLHWSKSSAFDFFVENKQVLKGAEMLSLLWGRRGCSRWGGGLGKSTQVTKTCQMPGKSSTESLHRTRNNAWEGGLSARAAV